MRVTLFCKKKQVKNQPYHTLFCKKTRQAREYARYLAKYRVKKMSNTHYFAKLPVDEIKNGLFMFNGCLSKWCLVNVSKVNGTENNPYLDRLLVAFTGMAENLTQRN